MADKQQRRITPELAAARWSVIYREDADFRASFDKDPKAAIAGLLGKDLPSEVEIVVHRSKPGQVHVVVPNEIPDMTDEQLEGISGGGAAFHKPYVPNYNDPFWDFLDEEPVRRPQSNWHNNWASPGDYGDRNRG